MLGASDRRVRVLARHPIPDGIPGDDMEVVTGDVRDSDTLDVAIDGVQTVVSAMSGFGGREPLGTHAVDRDGNLRLIDAARASGVSHFVLLSIHQAAPDHPMPMLRDKWAAEEALRASGLSWTIIRPTAYLETWLGILGDPLATSGTTRVFGRGQNPINFVSAADVARFVKLAMVEPDLRGAAIEVPGPQNLTLDELAAVVGTAIGQPARIRHVPPLGMRLARLLTRPFKPVLSAQIAAALVMDARDMSVDGPSRRAAYPAIPMTTAVDVAAGMFGSGAAVSSQKREPIA
jgi:uncharacterized protein YbjT (DUF2867 family)